MEEVIKKIFEQTGAKLVLCDCFTGVRLHNGQKYFNVVTEKPTFCAPEWPLLERMASKGIINKIAPNGYKRIAVYFN